MSKGKLEVGQPENVKLIDKTTGKEVMVGQTITFHSPKAFVIDWTKVENFEDMKKIMEAMDVTIYDSFKYYEKLKPFLIEK